MRPLLLEMNAFGPYSGKVSLDFSKIETENIFLITGPTGAGKTSILDAMVYALYGETSNDKRSGMSMRSQYADSTVMTKVIFQFAIGDKKYQIVRSPKQELKKKRGTGTKIEEPHAALSCWKDNDWKLISNQKNRIKEEILSIVGFRVDQFKQVVLLPQGDFRRLLVASSTEREDLLHGLFKLEIYKRLQELLKQKYETELGAAKENLERQKFLLESVHAETLQDLDKQLSCIVEQIAVAQVEKNKANGLLKRAKAWQQYFIEQTSIEKQLADIDQNFASLENALRDIKLSFVELNIQERNLQKEENNYQKSIKKLNQLKLQEDTYELILVKEREVTILTQQIAESEEKVAKVREKEKSLTEKLITVNQKIENINSWNAEHPAEAGKWTELYEYRNILQMGLNVSRGKSQKNIDIRKQEELVNFAFNLKQDKYRSWEICQLAFDATMAYELAKNLKDKEPCPVCGATEHPHPLHQGVQEVSKEEVKTAEQIYAEANNQYQKEKTILERLRQERQTIQHEFSQWLLGDRLNSHTEFVGKIHRALIVDETDILKNDNLTLDNLDINSVGTIESLFTEELNCVEAKLDIITKLTKEREVQDVLLTSLQKDKEEYLKEQKQASEEQTGLVREKQVVEVQLATLQSSIITLKEALIYPDKESWAVEKIKLSTIIQQWEEQAKLLTIKRQELIGEEANYKGQIISLQASKKDLQADLLAVNDDIKEVCEYFSTIFETVKVEEVYNLCENKFNEALAAETRLEELRKQYSKVKEEVDRLLDKDKKNRGNLILISRLYELANGGKTGIKGLTFERFVLGAILDEVLAAANLRLWDMSRGRYRLLRSKVEDSGQGGKGLDLSVYDTFTGYERAATTLSGGETFLASLSLALGLADIVQSYAGGIHLDTIFIDEGFGTLDSDTLDVALQTLVKLQKSGRMIGLISHVPELKQRIPIHLEVKKVVQGSEATFNI